MSAKFIIHTPEEIGRIRRAAQLTAQVRGQLRDLLKPGMSTREADLLAGALIGETGGKSAFLGYCGFPGNICISINNEVIHGIGDDRIIGEDDLVSIDVGVAIDGAIGDCALTFTFKEPDAERRRLLDGTRQALAAGLAAAKSGNRVRDISRAVEEVAKRFRLGIVRDYTGHGCGTVMHEPPEVPNYVNSEIGPRLVPGMVLCVEPMLNLGRGGVTVDRKNHWTVRTADGSDSAHFEDMVLITDNQPEILTSGKR